MILRGDCRVRETTVDWQCGRQWLSSCITAAAVAVAVNWYRLLKKEHEEKVCGTETAADIDIDKRSLPPSPLLFY